MSALVAAGCGGSGDIRSNGPYRPVGSGDAGMTHWRVERSTATGGGECLRVVVPPSVNEEGCAPKPSLTDGGSQPLQLLALEQGPEAKVPFVMGSVVASASAVRVVYRDGSFDMAQSGRGFFMAFLPADKTVTELRPAVSGYPNLRCKVVSLGQGNYGDDGCTGYPLKP